MVLIAPIRDLVRFAPQYEDWAQCMHSCLSSPLFVDCADACSNNPVTRLLSSLLSNQLLFKPTGNIVPKNFSSNVAKYEVLEPEQMAFGDWAAISIGGQYYLFGDFHPADGDMGVAWFIPRYK